MPKFRSQGEIIRVFTLMICPEIASQIVKISYFLKTCDMSDLSAIGPDLRYRCTAIVGACNLGCLRIDKKIF
jgi:hypothetical protein